MSTSQTNEVENHEDESKHRLLSVLGHLSRKRRESLGITAEELCERTDISLTEILRFELGDWDIDTLSLLSITRCLKTSAAAMFEEMERAL